MAHPQEAALLGVVDLFLARAATGDIADADELEVIMNAVLGEGLPGAASETIEALKPEALRYVIAAMRNAGLLGEMPGIPMTQMLDDGTRIRPLRVFTGVLAAVVFIDNKDTLMPIEHWVLPLAQQLALENLIQDTFGTAGDAVSVCTFPFQPADFRPLGVESILTDNFAAGALRTADTDFDVPFRQSLLRRSPPSRIWAMPDGQLAMPIFLPVTVMSILSPYYWEHGRDDEQATADQLGLILAAGLAERELLGCEIEVYCGHLHVSDDLDTVMRDITMDLTERGGQLRLYPHRNPPKVGRNLACPCGSGLKYKKCCAN